MPRVLFKKGQSGNPKGRKKNSELVQVKQEQQQIIADVRAAAKEMSAEALQTLKSALTAPKAPWATKVTAASLILDRGWGKPRETVDVTHRKTLEDLVLESMRPNHEAEAYDEPKRLN